MRTQLFFTLFLLLGIHCTAQELTGPDRISPGTLASFEIVPAQEASWHIVTPLADAETYKTDTGLAKLYFASPERGRYTVVAGIVIDGKPKLLAKTFVNDEADIKPLPVPVPLVSSLETWINTQTPLLVKSKNFVSESRLVADCFEQIVHRIETENIKTAQNAQTQLQIALTAALAKASPTAITDWLPFVTELSRRMEQELGEKMDNLAEVKKVIQNVGNAMKTLESPAPESPTPLRDVDDPKTRGTQNRIFRNILSQ